MMDTEAWLHSACHGEHSFKNFFVPHALLDNKMTVAAFLGELRWKLDAGIFIYHPRWVKGKLRDCLLHLWERRLASHLKPRRMIVFFQLGYEGAYNTYTRSLSVYVSIHACLMPGYWTDSPHIYKYWNSSATDLKTQLWKAKVCWK